MNTDSLRYRDGGSRHEIGVSVLPDEKLIKEVGVRSKKRSLEKKLLYCSSIQAKLGFEYRFTDFRLKGGLLSCNRAAYAVWSRPHSLCLGSLSPTRRAKAKVKRWISVYPLSQLMTRHDNVQNRIQEAQLPTGIRRGFGHCLPQRSVR